MTRWQKLDLDEIKCVIKGPHNAVIILYNRYYGWSLMARNYVTGKQDDIAYFQEPRGSRDPTGMPSVDGKEWTEEEVLPRAEEIAVALGYIDAV